MNTESIVRYIPGFTLVINFSRVNQGAWAQSSSLESNIEGLASDGIGARVMNALSIGIRNVIYVH